jgi:hypothetical protein
VRHPFARPFAADEALRRAPEREIAVDSSSVATHGACEAPAAHSGAGGDSMSLEHWLDGAMTLDAFRANVLGRQSYRGKGLASLARAHDWDSFERLVANERPPDLELGVARGLTPRAITPQSGAVRALLSTGLGVRLRDAHALDRELAELADALERELEGRATVDLSASPASGRARWRRQTTDVFMIQTEGTQAHDVQPETRDAAPLRCVLAPGDWLYVPRGWFRGSDAVEDALTLDVHVTLANESQTDAEPDWQSLSLLHPFAPRLY